MRKHQRVVPTFCDAYYRTNHVRMARLAWPDAPVEPVRPEWIYGPTQVTTVPERPIWLVRALRWLGQTVLRLVAR